MEVENPRSIRTTTGRQTSNAYRSNTSTTNHKAVLDKRLVDFDPPCTTANGDSLVIAGDDNVVHLRQVNGDSSTIDVCS
jgi:hypothetical protein